MATRKGQKVESEPGHPAHEERMQWEAARTVVESLGRMPISFTTPIRALQLDGRGGKVMRPATQCMVGRLLRSATVKAGMYYAALTFHGDRLNNTAYLPSVELVRTFAPDEVATLLGLIFVHSRIIKVGRLAENAEWRALSEASTLRSEVGGHLGYAISSLGAARAMIVGGLRPLARAMFLLIDRDCALRYDQHLRAARLRCDLEFELEHWGCTHLHVGANLLQQLGFGVTVAHAFMVGLDPRKQPELDKDQQAFEMLVTDDWINALLETGTKPQGLHLGQYYPLERDAYKLLYEVDRLRREGSKYRWLQRARKDINPHETPQLFQEFLQELQQSKALMQFYQEHLPPEILDSLSPEELEELSAVDKQEEL